MSKKEKNTEESYIPPQYLNNENPYAFRYNYDNNLASLSMNKERLNTLHRLQPQKLNTSFNQQNLDDERKYMITEAIKVKRKNVLERAFKAIEREPVYTKESETILEEFIDNETVLDALIELKKMNLIYHQMRLRARVSHVISAKIADNTRIDTSGSEKVVVDNLREGLIFSNLKKFYEDDGKESEQSQTE